MYRSIYAYMENQEDLGTWPSAIKSDCRIFLPTFSGVCVLVGLLQSIPMVGLICKERYGSAILSSDYLPAGPIAQVGQSHDARNGEVRFF